MIKVCCKVSKEARLFCLDLVALVGSGSGEGERKIIKLKGRRICRKCTTIVQYSLLLDQRIFVLIVFKNSLDELSGLAAAASAIKDL